MTNHAEKVAAAAYFSFFHYSFFIYMLYITQLIYLKAGQEAIFDEFEAVAIPSIARYNGRLLFRLRPGKTADYIELHMPEPYEIHLVEFDSELDFKAFMQDETRKQFLHLKEQSIQSAILYKGEKL